MLCRRILAVIFPAKAEGVDLRNNFKSRTEMREALHNSKLEGLCVPTKPSQPVFTVIIGCKCDDLCSSLQAPEETLQSRITSNHFVIIFPT